MRNIHKLRVIDYLDHIIEAIQRIYQYIDDVSEVTFLTNSMMQDAVIRNFEIIGEACRNIERHFPDISEKYPSLPLGSAYEMRNFLAHGYFKIDLEIVWKTIENDLPDIERQIKQVREEIISLK